MLSLNFKVPNVLSSGGFFPNSIAGLSLWLDAADLNTIVLNGSDVSEWHDKSGGGFMASQSVAIDQPLYSNGEIVFDGSNELNVNFTYNWQANEFTIYTVQENDGDNAFRGVLGNRFGAGSSKWFTLGHVSTSSQFIVEMSSPTGGTGFDPAFNDVGQPAFICTFIKKNIPSYTLRKNDGSEAVTLTAHDVGNTTNDLRIGRWLSTGQRWDGKINEILIFNKVLTSEENTAVIDYLTTKWGIT